MAAPCNRSSIDRQYVLNPHHFHPSWQHWQLYLSVIKVEMAGRLEFLYLKEKITFYLCAQRGQKVRFSAVGVRGSCELLDMLAGN